MHCGPAIDKNFEYIVFIPMRNFGLSSIVIELKHNKTTDSAIEQVKNKNYTKKIVQYIGESFLVGINYDDKKVRAYKFERFVKKVN